MKSDGPFVFDLTHGTSVSTHCTVTLDATDHAPVTAKGAAILHFANAFAVTSDNPGGLDPANGASLDPDCAIVLYGRPGAPIDTDVEFGDNRGRCHSQENADEKEEPVRE